MYDFVLTPYAAKHLAVIPKNDCNVPQVPGALVFYIISYLFVAVKYARLVTLPLLDILRVGALNI